MFICLFYLLINNVVVFCCGAGKNGLSATDLAKNASIRDAIIACIEVS